MKKSCRTNRRDFLRRGLGAAPAVVAPCVLPRHVLGIQATPGANEQVVLGIVGMGMRGGQLVRNIPAAGRIAAICDVNTRKTAAAMKRFPADWKVYDDYRRLLDRKDLTALIVAPCDHHHVQAAMLACQTGLDLYVEKPLSFYLKEGQALVKAARKHKRVVQVGSQQRTMEIDRFACEFVRDGGIGKVLCVECVNSSSPSYYVAADFPQEPVPPTLDWDLWQGSAPARPYNHLLAAHWDDDLSYWWGKCRDYSMRQTGLVGAHGLDMIQYAMGADESGSVEFRLVEPPSPTARVEFRYANGVEVRARFHEGPGPLQRGPQCGAVFSGEKCKIEINRNKFTTNPKDFVKNGPDPKMRARWEGPDSIALGHVQNWFDCIKSRGKPNVDVEIGHRTASVGHIINIVRQVGTAGETLKWDPAAERFTNNERGNALLDRPRRKGWELPSV